MPSPSQPDHVTSDPQLSIQVTGDEPIAIRLTGEIDLCTASQLTGKIEEILQTGPRQVVLDVRGLTFCDVRGLAAFVETHLRVQAAGGSLRLVGISDALGRLLSISDLTRVLQHA
jgi:anti-sigma B factor antagonist